ncbi:MAG TPA: hypothetical protein VFA26_02035 [Gemmataceae bacterium]|nr:hypothetical protein [Gemmataceae bacterium]
MRPRRWLTALALLAAGAAPAAADPPKLPVPTPAELLKGSTVDGLAGTLRGYLAHHLPPILFEQGHDWGRTVAVKRFGKTRPKKDGDWKRVRVTAGNLPDTLILDIRDVRSPEPGRLAFGVYLAFDARVEYDHERWERGIKLWDNHVQARMRVRLALDCEVTARLEPNGSLLPDAVLRLRVVKANLRYDNLVVEHVLGIGGEGARLLGDAARAAVKQFKPNLERDLLARADAAIVKAGDTREVRVRLNDLLKKKARPQ